MSDQQPLSVQLEAMSRYASAMEELGTAFERTRRGLVDADVTGGSLGGLPESREAAAVYERRTTDGLAVLRSGADVFGDLAVTFRRLRDSYRASDGTGARRIGSAG